MLEVDIAYSTTVATTTVVATGDPGAVALPDGFPPIAAIPTTQYIEGGGGLLEAHVKDYWKDTGLIRIHRQAVKHNILKLHYRPVGDLVR